MWHNGPLPGICQYFPRSCWLFSVASPGCWSVLLYSGDRDVWDGSSKVKCVLVKKTAFSPRRKIVPWSYIIIILLLRVRWYYHPCQCNGLVHALHSIGRSLAHPPPLSLSLSLSLSNIALDIKAAVPPPAASWRKLIARRVICEELGLQWDKAVWVRAVTGWSCCSLGLLLDYFSGRPVA